MMWFVGFWFVANVLLNMGWWERGRLCIFVAGDIWELVLSGQFFSEPKTALKYKAYLNGGGETA